MNIWEQHRLLAAQEHSAHSCSQQGQFTRGHLYGAVSAGASMPSGRDGLQMHLMTSGREGLQAISPFHSQPPSSHAWITAAASHLTVHLGTSYSLSPTRRLEGAPPFHSVRLMYATCLQCHSQNWSIVTLQGSYTSEFLLKFHDKL